MIKLIKYLLCASVVFITAGTLHAQTYNDTVRTATWSIYAQGGVSNYHGTRSDLFYRSDNRWTPEISLGVNYNLKPWIRLGLNFDYFMLKSSSEKMISKLEIVEDFQIEGHPAILEIQSDRLQNGNISNVAGADLNVDFNLFAIWPQRKAQWMNFYVGVGVGYLHGWNANSLTVAYDESAVAESSTYFNVYSHSYLVSSNDKSQFNSLYIPVTASLEFDVNRNVTLGIYGKYRSLPVDQDFAPEGIYSAGLRFRYNFVDSKVKLQRIEIANLKRIIEENRIACEESAKLLNEKYQASEKQLREEISRLNSDVNTQKELLAKAPERSDCLIVYFGNNLTKLTDEGETLLTDLAGFLKDYPDREISVVGSANLTGNREKNVTLAKNRVKSVKDFLVSQGVKEEQITAEAYVGDEGMTTSEQDRRVVIAIHPKK